MHFKFGNISKMTQNATNTASARILPAGINSLRVIQQYNRNRIMVNSSRYQLMICELQQLLKDSFCFYSGVVS